MLTVQTGRKGLKRKVFNKYFRSPGHKSPEKYYLCGLNKPILHYH